METNWYLNDAFPFPLTMEFVAPSIIPSEWDWNWYGPPLSMKMTTEGLSPSGSTIVHFIYMGFFGPR
jgi:hypothetical protein